jgi:hypothetical protein
VRTASGPIGTNVAYVHGVQPLSAVAATVLLPVSLAACALTAPVPAGALRPGTTTQIAPSWAIAYGAGSATVGETRIHGNGQTYGGPTGVGSFLPLRLALRQSIGGVADVGGDVGWLDAGVDVRVGTNDQSDVPFSIMAGVRSGQIAFHIGEKTHEWRAQVEVDPRLSQGADRSTRLILAAGIAGGSFAHAIMLPDGLRSEGGDAPNFDPPGAIFVRPEIRLELGVGLDVRRPQAAASFVLAPWILLDSQAPTRTACSDCQMAIGEFSQSWGLALIITPKVSGDPLGRLFGTGGRRDSPRD